MRWVLIVLLTAQVATCGQMGPLYLPEDAQLAPAASASIAVSRT